MKRAAGRAATNLCIPSPGQKLFFCYLVSFSSLHSEPKKRRRRAKESESKGIHHQPIFLVLFSGFVLWFSIDSLMLKLYGLGLHTRECYDIGPEYTLY